MQTHLKTTSLFFVTLLVVSLNSSCDLFNKKEQKTDQFDTTGKMYSLVPKTTSVFWTAYKTSDRVPVNGQFMKLNINNIKKEKTVKEAIEGSEFSIPVSSLFSKEDERDTKLKELFFGVMDNTEFLSGTLSIVNDSLTIVSLKMNSVTKDIPMSYFISGQMLSMEATINLDDWGVQAAMDSLHKACEEQHTGEDGVSETWSDVTINVESYLMIE